MKNWAVDRDTVLFLSASSMPSNFGVTIYNRLFRARGLNYLYLPRRVTAAAELAAALRTLDIRGCSVSMPLKTDIIAHLDEVDESARAVRSVNTVLNEKGRLRAFNTDAHGFREALPRPFPKRVLVYGSGSVTTTILAVLDQLGVGNVQRWARNPSHRRWDGAACDLLVNATPMSLAPLSPEVTDMIGRCAKVFDLVVPRRENFLDVLCRERRIPYLPGFEMYKHQCARQFEIYTGLRIEPDEIEAVAREAGLI